MKTKTKSRLSDPKFLTRRLKRISRQTWEAYVVEGDLFTSHSGALTYARRMAAVKEASVWVSTVKIPTSLPTRATVSVSGVTCKEKEHERFRDVRVFFVLGKPFFTWEEAEVEAQSQADCSGKKVLVMFSVVEMKDTDFFSSKSPSEAEAGAK